MSALSASANGEGGALPSPSGAFSSILNTAVGIAAAKLERKITAWTDKLNGVAQDGHGDGDSTEVLRPLAEEGLDQIGEAGTPEKIGAEGVKAKLEGKNPVMGALKGAWQSGTPVIRAAIITAAVGAVVLLLVSPVLLVVFALALLVTAATHRGGPDKTEEKKEDKT